MFVLANSVELDEMPYYVTFYQGLHIRFFTVCQSTYLVVTSIKRVRFLHTGQFYMRFGYLWFFKINFVKKKNGFPNYTIRVSI